MHSLSYDVGLRTGVRFGRSKHVESYLRLHCSNGRGLSTSAVVTRTGTMKDYAARFTVRRLRSVHW